MGLKLIHKLPDNALERYAVDKDYLTWTVPTPEPSDYATSPFSVSSDIVMASIENSIDHEQISQSNKPHPSTKYHNPPTKRGLSYILLSDPDDPTWGKKKSARAKKGKRGHATKKAPANRVVKHGAITKKDPGSNAKKSSAAKYRATKAAMKQLSLEPASNAVKLATPMEEDEGGTPSPAPRKLSGGSGTAPLGLKGLNMSRADAGVVEEGNPAGRIGLTGLVSPRETGGEAEYA